MPETLPTLDAKFDDAKIEMHDSVHGHAMTFDRLVDIPAGRVAPGEPYLRFKHFVDEAASALDRDVAVGS